MEIDQDFTGRAEGEVAQVSAVLRTPGNQSTTRVLKVLSALSERSGPAGVTELSKQLGMSLNMVHRALTTLMEHGYVVRTSLGPDLGPAVLSLDRHSTADLDLRNQCRPFMESLYRLTGESVFLSIIVDFSRVIIESVEPRGQRIARIERGRTIPLHQTITGQTLLAALDDQEVETYLERVDLSLSPAAAIGNAEELRTAIARIRSVGYGLSSAETMTGVNSNFIAFAVLDGNNRALAAITIGGPSSRFTMERAAGFLPGITTVRHNLNRKLQHLTAITSLAGSNSPG